MGRGIRSWREKAGKMDRTIPTKSKVIGISNIYVSTVITCNRVGDATWQWCTVAINGGSFEFLGSL